MSCEVCQEHSRCRDEMFELSVQGWDLRMDSGLTIDQPGTKVPVHRRGVVHPWEEVSVGTPVEISPRREDGRVLVHLQRRLLGSAQVPQ